MIILGLDISTSITGVSLVNGLMHEGVVLVDHMDFKGCDDMWQKADFARKFLLNIKEKYGTPDHIYVEESLMAFRSGLSSAATIATLLKFNALVSYMCRDIFGKDPKFIASVTARKRCGIKINKLDSRPGKEQVFEWASNGPLSKISWPKKKSGQPKDWAKDATDAYVVGLAGFITETNCDHAVNVG